MNLPFSIEQFLQVFKNYNVAVWPAQIIFYLFSFVMIFLAIRKSKNKSTVINIILAFLWLWMGIVYHWGFFTPINKAAWVFGILNVVQGFVFFYFGVLKSRITYGFQRNIFGITGIFLIIYALVVYPVIGHFSGHSYPYSPTFGLPCPTTIFTFGMLLFVDKRLNMWVLIIPLLWSFVGTTAALNFGIVEDVGLLISGLITLILILYRNRVTC